MCAKDLKETIKIGIIGLGHVGLPTALGFAELGEEVVGVDDDREKVVLISDGVMPFHEPGAELLLRKHLGSGRFRVEADVSNAVVQSEVLFVCVGTPQREDGSADLSQVEAVARTIAQNLSGYKLIVEKSTTPVRTAEQIKRTILRYRNGDQDFEVAVNPEFLREGSAIHDFFNPRRIVLGVESSRSRDLLLRIYQPLLDRLSAEKNEPSADKRVLVTNLNTAEIIKHASNAFLATKISFINMVADLCEATNADVGEVAYGLGLDPRIGPEFLQAGVGFGGYCLPKDLRALIRIGEQQEVNVGFLREVEHINQQRIERVLEKIRQALWVLRGKTVGILGLAFKPMTDDIREAPSLRIIDRLLREGVSLRLHDPQAMGNMQRYFPAEPGRLMYSRSPEDVATGADAVLLLTEWEDYRILDLARVREVMNVPILIDARNLFDPQTARSLGFEYISVGRP